MKTRIFFALMLICLACTNNKPLSDSEKQTITGEVKDVIAQIYNAAEKADFNTILKFIDNSPENVMLSPDGKFVGPSEWNKAYNDIFSSMASQKITTLTENYRILDRNTVWYTSVTKSQVNFKDSSILMQNPWNTYFLLKKIDNTWKCAGLTEWGHEEIVKPAPLPKDLDQLELSKQFLGQWRCEYGDTITVFDQQPFGKAQVASFKTSVKGKPFSEARQLWSFDRTNNRLTYMGVGKQGLGAVVSLKFTTPTTYTTIPYNNISNPAYAPFRIEGEFVNPDTYVEKVILKNETVFTYTSKRIK